MIHAVLWLVAFLVSGAYIAIIGSAILLGWRSNRMPDGTYATEDLELVA